MALYSANRPADVGRDSTSKCAFCKRPFRKEQNLIFGQRESGTKFDVHYFCLLLATHLLQNGEDDEGIKGFLEADIEKELRRARNERCAYCRRTGASSMCAKKACRKTFHFPCGFERGAVPDFNTKTLDVLCNDHAPVQEIRPALNAMATAECLVCLEPLQINLDKPLPRNLIVSPCCKQLYEKDCLRGYANCAGLHHFKCSHCRNIKKFRYACRQHGIFVPDQDAEWELNNEFADHYVPHSLCDVPICLCPEGRTTIQDHKDWEVVRCDDCGKSGTHIKCSNLSDGTMSRYQCNDCSPVGVASTSDGNRSVPSASPSSCSRRTRSSNVRFYLASKLHAAFKSEEVIVLKKEPDDQPVDIDDSGVADVDNKKNKSQDQDSPPRTIKEEDRCSTPVQCHSRRSDENSGNRYQSGSPILSTPTKSANRKRRSPRAETPSKSPSRPLRQLTLEGFTSPHRTKPPSLPPPSTTHQNSPSKLQSSMTPRRSMTLTSPAKVASPCKKKIRSRKLLKGQMTLDFFLKSPIDTSPVKTLSSPKKQFSFREWIVQGPSTSSKTEKKLQGHPTPKVVGKAAVCHTDEDSD